MLKTIEEVFSDNLKRLRGDRTQAEIAELADVPLRSYQKSEAQQLPRPDNRRAIARALGVLETELFLDDDLVEAPRGVPAKLRLLELVAAFDEDQAKALLPDAQAIKAGLRPPGTREPQELQADKRERDSG